MGTYSVRRAAAGTALLLLFYMIQVILVGAGPALADHVDPVFIEGNQNCSAATGTEEIRRLEGDDLSDGDYEASNGETITVTFDGDIFDWTSTGLIAAVFVKGGPDGNLYDYRPGGELSDNGLHSPLNPANGKYYGISHITFCEFEDSTTPTTQGTTTTTQGTTTTTEGEGTTTTTQGTTTTQPRQTSTAPSFQNVGVDVTGVCSTDPARSGKSDLMVTISIPGGATVTLNGQAYTSSATVLGAADETTFTWSATPNGGYALVGITSGTLTIGRCDATVLGTVIEATTTVPAVQGESLPFTGFEARNILLAAIGLLWLGGLLVEAGKMEDSRAKATNLGQWNR